MTGPARFARRRIRTRITAGVLAATSFAAGAAIVTDDDAPATPVVVSVARVNFQRDTGAVPEGYLRDYGQAFDSVRGYGWIEQSSPTPLSIVGNARNRNINLTDERLDTFVHMQFTGTPANGVPVPARWEYALAPGTYRLTVAVGDPTAVFDSAHQITAEATTLIDGFVPTSGERHRTVTADVLVDDGRLTLDAAGGTNTKIDYVDIALVDDGPEPPATTDYLWRVNFQREVGPIPSGYVRDFGQAFDETRGYGWIEPSSSLPQSMTAFGRNRNVNNTDERLDTLMHMQPLGSPARWEAVVPDGTYDVTVGVGDAAFLDSIHRVTVEDTPAIVNFVPTSGERHSIRTVRVVVTDGHLTLDAAGGTNTKINFVDVGIVDPRFMSMTPANGSGGVSTTASVILLPNQPVEPSTATISSIAIEGPDGVVLANYNTDAAGGVVAITPTSPLHPNTLYTVTTTEDVLNLDGVPFAIFSASFTTGAGGAPAVPVQFDRTVVDESVPAPSSLTFGPDGRLYVASATGRLVRYDRDAEGRVVSAAEELAIGLENERLIIGLAFSPDSTAEDLHLWVAHNALVLDDAPHFTGMISEFSGPDLSTRRDVIVGLPRSTRDHMTNSIVFGPDERLYIAQGSMNGYGAPDSFWGFRAETPLSGAILVADVLNDPALSSTLDVVTAPDGTYDPSAPGAPVRTYAEGLRNPYDMLWHSNGSFYAPVNESASGNTPAGPGDQPPARFGLPPGNDYFARVIEGEYYGHPNPSIGRFTLNGGNPTAAVDYFEVPQYPVGTLPDPDWQAPLYDFGRNRSPNGVAEYTSDVFGPALQGAVLVTEFSAGDDIQAVFLNEAGNVQGVSTLATGFDNPLDVVADEHGNVFITEFRDAGSGSEGRVLMLEPIPAGSPAVIDVDSPDERLLTGPRLVFSTVLQEDRPAKNLAVRNIGASPLLITGVEIGGADAESFRLTPGSPASFTVPAGGIVNVPVEFRPTTTQIEFEATITISSSDETNPEVELVLAGLNAVGYEGVNEPPVATLLRVLGYTTDIGYTSYKICNYTGSNERSDCELPRGEEVMSPYWRRVNPSVPVGLFPIASFRGRQTAPQGNTGWTFYAPPTQTTTPTRRSLHTFAGGSDVSGGENQRLLPRPTGVTTFVPTSTPFGLFSYFSDFSDERFHANKLHNFRFYPARGPDGALIPDTYLVTFDPSGGSAKNWDYNDLMWVMTNVAPEFATNGVSTPVVAEFRTAAPGTFVDAAGLTTGLVPSGAGSSTDSADLSVDRSSTGLMSVTARPGTNHGTTNAAVNLLGAIIDTTEVHNLRTGARLWGSACLPGDGATEAGVWFGPDADNFYSIVLANGAGGPEIRVRFEQLGVSTSVATIPVTDCASVRWIELTIRTFSGTGRVGYQYSIDRVNGTTSGTITGPQVSSVTHQQLWYNQAGRAGITTSSTAAGGYTAVFDRWRFYL
jgi:glucose/arabinose dehydrogenase